MSLNINGKLTPKQIQTLKDLDYVGKWDLTVDEAAEIITELYDQRRMMLDEGDGPDDYIKYGD